MVISPWGWAGASNDTLLFNYQTPAREQGIRKTCVIFSVTALFETYLVTRWEWDRAATDLSEEWLAYLVVSQAFLAHRPRTDGYYGAQEVIQAGLTYGMLRESEWTYNTYTGKTIPPEEIRKRCLHLYGAEFDQCLIAHRDPYLLTTSDEELLNKNSVRYDPEFYKMRHSAQAFRRKYLGEVQGVEEVRGKEEIKESLENHIPMVLNIPLFYSAWHHPRSVQNSYRSIDDSYFYRGIVSYPSKVKGSYSVPNHSILVIGFDDERKVPARTLVTKVGPSFREEGFTGVYYFKNEWYPPFGKDFRLKGVPYPGFGEISEKYAEDFGTFYKLLAPASNRLGLIRTNFNGSLKN